MMEWTWGLTMLSIFGVVLNNHQDRRCFYIWIVTNSLWAVVAFGKGIPAQGTMFLVYLALSLHGLWKWRHKGVQREAVS